jgi:hypothetical protein
VARLDQTHSIKLDEAVGRVAHLQSLFRTLKEMSKTFRPALKPLGEITNAIQAFAKRQQKNEEFSEFLSKNISESSDTHDYPSAQIRPEGGLLQTQHHIYSPADRRTLRYPEIVLRRYVVFYSSFAR